MFPDINNPVDVIWQCLQKPSITCQFTLCPKRQDVSTVSQRNHPVERVWHRVSTAEATTEDVILKKSELTQNNSLSIADTREYVTTHSKATQSRGASASGFLCGLRTTIIAGIIPLVYRLVSHVRILFRTQPMMLQIARGCLQATPP